jgi:hypothetical protein
LEIGTLGSRGIPKLSRFEMRSRRNPNLMRQVAGLAAIFLLLGQTLAAAHFHRTSAQRELSAGGAAGIADSACPICAAHLNTSAPAPVVPTLDAPTIADKLVPHLMHRAPSSTFLQSCFGRAPPARIEFPTRDI